MKQFLETKLNELLNQDAAEIAQRNRSRYDTIVGHPEKPVILFGAGFLGLKTLAGLRNMGIEPLGFTDNNPALWNQMIKGLPVVSPIEAVNRFGDNAVFIITIFHTTAVKQQLRELNPRWVVSYIDLYWKYEKEFLPYGGIDHPRTIIDQADQVRKAFSIWGDEASQEEYIAQLAWRFSLDSKFLPEALPEEQTYFPSDLVTLNKDEVFVDCGAFTGDSMQSFYRRAGGNFKQMVAFEPDPTNCENLRKYIGQLPPEQQNKVHIHQKAVGDRPGKLTFETTGTAASHLGGAGIVEVDTVRMDDTLDHSLPTYIKMDIEGAELQALHGSARIIEQASAVWAICLYHQNEHLWQIPLMMSSLSDGYEFFLRRYAEDCWELMCYAVPKDRRLAR